MRQRIKRVAPVQVAKVMAVLYLVMGLCFLPFFLIFSSTVPEGSEQAIGFPMGLGFAVMMPIFYAVFGFIFTLIGAALYNVVAGFVGGIEVEFEPAGPAMPA